MARMNIEMLPIYKGRMPVMTEGACFYSDLKRKQGCRNYHVTLGDGVCMECADKGRKGSRKKITGHEGKGIREALARVRAGREEWKSGKFL